VDRGDDPGNDPAGELETEWRQVSYYAPVESLGYQQHDGRAQPGRGILADHEEVNGPGEMKRDPHVLPAQFAPPAERVGPVQSGPTGYPVPYPPMTPKHLFHFIIRYEGEGSSIRTW